MLPSLTTAFLLGLFCGSQVPFFPIASFLVLAGLAVGSNLLERAGTAASRTMLILYGALLSGVLYWTALVPPPHSDRMQTEFHNSHQSDMGGRIVAPVQYAPERQTLLVEVQEVDQEFQLVRLVWREPGTALHYGDRIAFRATLRPPIGSMNPGGFDYAAYAERQGIDLTATVTGEQAVRVVESGAESWRWMAGNQIDRWRAMVRTAARATLNQPALGVYLGIIIGERGFLQRDLQEWFMVTGTVHLLSISGSHLGLVAIVVFWAVKQMLLRLPPKLLLELSRIITPSRVAILATWPVVALYAWLAGAELATIRSLAMITLALAALWLGHERHAYHAMAAAALIIVLHNPAAIFDISFQLSFLSVLVMIRTVQWLEARSEEPVDGDQWKTVRAAVRSGRDALVMSGAVTMATLPIVALYFNQIPWMGVVTNVGAVPFTGVVLVPLGLLAAVWTIVSGDSHLMAGGLIDQLLVLMIDALRWCAGFPGGEWHIAAPSIPAIVLFYAAFITAGVGMLSRPLRMAGAGVVVTMVCVWGLSLRAGADGERWRVTFLDVGQGDSAVIELPDGQTVLIDGGARYERFDMGQGVVAPFLWNRGIHHVEHVVGTHQQLDHVGGLIWVLRHISVDRYWGNGVERPEHFVADLKSALNERRIPYDMAVRGQDLLESGPCTLIVLNPGAEDLKDPSIQPYSGALLNNQSIVLRLQCGEHAVLFAADIETAGLRRLDEEGRRPVTVLKIPHHGARSSFDREWISQVKPRYAVVSAGRANPYGHPVREVLQAYENQHATVFRTDRDGAVWIEGRLSVSDMTVTRMRDLLLQPVALTGCIWRCEQENWRRLWIGFRGAPGLIWR